LFFWQDSLDFRFGKDHFTRIAVLAGFNLLLGNKLACCGHRRAQSKTHEQWQLSAETVKVSGDDHILVGKNFQIDSGVVSSGYERRRRAVSPIATAAATVAAIAASAPALD
jgi:hypothetical protein